MENILLIAAIIFAIVGLVGSVVPVLPGPPVGYVALWMMWWRNKEDISEAELWVMGIAMVLVTIIDFLAPVWLTKIGGGTKQGVRGATAGLLIGLCFMPWGLVFGPFIGAMIGELSQSSTFSRSIKVAAMSFLSFLLTTGLKLIYGIVVVALMIL